MSDDKQDPKHEKFGRARSASRVVIRELAEEALTYGAGVIAAHWSP